MLPGMKFKGETYAIALYTITPTVRYTWRSTSKRVSRSSPRCGLTLHWPSCAHKENRDSSEN